MLKIVPVPDAGDIGFYCMRRYLLSSAPNYCLSLQRSSATDRRHGNSLCEDVINTMYEEIGSGTSLALTFS